MNIALINKETNTCENVAVFEDIEKAITIFGEDYNIVEVEADASYGIGDTFKDGIWFRKQDLVNKEKENSVETSINKRTASISKKLASLLMRQ